MKNTNNMITKCFKKSLLHAIILFIILYILKIILSLCGLLEIKEIYYYAGIIIGIFLERNRTRKIFKMLDELIEIFKHKI
jgi:hypothetical protein